MANQTGQLASFKFLYEPTPWENTKGAIVGITATAIGLSAACVLARLYVRFRVVRAPGWDDAFVCVFLLTTLSSGIAVTLGPDYGLGKHLILATAYDVRMFLILFYVSNSCYISSTAFIKLSLLFQYLRLYEKGTWLRRFCIGLIVAVSIWGSVFAFMAWVPCFPVHKYWDLLTPGTCYGFGITTSRDVIMAHTATNMVFDIVIFAIPTPLYFERSTPIKTRLGMVILFLLGCLVNVFAAWRLGLLVQSQHNFFATVVDPTWYAPDTILLAALEVTTASICASVPIFWPVLSLKLGNIFVTKEVQVTRGDRYIWESTGEGNDSQAKLAHYKDTFVMHHVDPLRSRQTGGFETNIRSDTGLQGKSKTGKGFGDGIWEAL